MKALALLLLAFPAHACDWRITSDRIDPMTDKRECIITSPSAAISLGVLPDRVFFLSRSAYSHLDRLKVRIDDMPALLARDNSRELISQIETGQRIRTHFLDYPYSHSGDAPICELPALIRSCQTP